MQNVGWVKRRAPIEPKNDDFQSDGCAIASPILHSTASGLVLKKTWFAPDFVSTSFRDYFCDSHLNGVEGIPKGHKRRDDE
jgi:hypothetical protein